MTHTRETTLEINLPAIKHNYNLLKGKIKPTTKFMAVVKAYAYGSDAPKIAIFLEKLGVDYFAVAYTDEGIALRNAGITKPILVLHPLPVHFNEIINYRLEPSLYSFNVLEVFLEAAKNEKEYPIHLKFNTGLNRLGFVKMDIALISGKLLHQKNVYVASVFSHLGASEDLNEKDFTMRQILSFKEIKASLAEKFSHKPLYHLLNTSGILNYTTSAQFDMVRSGIGLYGFGNDAQYDALFKTVLSLKSVISQIHNIAPGNSIGYNQGHIADKAMKTATIPLGHADGIGRQYGKGKAHVTIHGHKCPIVGNVCMDMLMVDVSEVQCKEGDEVLVFGKSPTAGEFAATAGTISYELIAGISQRVRRKIITH
ncbi:alanine racemase [Galbibacter pacificus]|uniref:Alanine racemase n=1 Tax=Galbibacter pacificus TaxID=2996052 RepID=A0ABT6FS35_9FLAO|nr:alanine racemase [Galbibacter pacificus]MDG3582799.1 alanine racemase [Galbibacter pacificus]MDG3586082.1 alanine racemase [Galbibacter pacificus]